MPPSSAALAVILRPSTGGRCGSTPNQPPPALFRGSQVNISILSQRWFLFCPKATIRENAN